MRESREDWNGWALTVAAAPAQTAGATGASPNAVNDKPLEAEDPALWATAAAVWCCTSTLVAAPSASGRAREKTPGRSSSAGERVTVTS
ncbi:hypothetical protein ACIA8I_25345 [Streptomyces rishiriensis]|uniref:hypothetical protein n=1 Tax=Streptomyces rishiriensis TaxID=68264 RepID=UPI00379772DD